MTVRGYFGVEDLARTHTADRLALHGEVLLSLPLLRSCDGIPGLARWRSRMLSRLKGPARALLTVASPRGFSPDFLPLVASVLGLDQGLRSLAATSRDRRFHADLRWFTERYQVALWLHTLTPERLIRSADTEHDYCTADIRPYEPRLRSHVEVGRSLRSPTQQSSGVQRLLSSPLPKRWQRHMLKACFDIPDCEVHPGGGLRLIASFCSHGLIMRTDPKPLPVLV